MQACTQGLECKLHTDNILTKQIGNIRWTGMAEFEITAELRRV